MIAQTQGKTLGTGDMFDAIAHRYDMLNRVLSLGLDQSWRRKTVHAVNVKEGDRVLDLATGTGDLALLFAQQNVRVTGLDPSEKMLAIAEQKSGERGYAPLVDFLCGDAQELPFDDNSFDGITMAFGIRNVPDRAKALREMHRVLKPGARTAILELSEPRSGLLGPLARFHIRKVVPYIGSILSGAREYRYLQESIAAFPPPDEFAQMMQIAGLRPLGYTPLTFGACVLYTGEES